MTTDIALRLDRLLSALSSRFPDLEYTSELPEDRFIKQIDELLKLKPKLCHHVVLNDWEHVKRVIALFKKKQHRQYLLDVQELEPSEEKPWYSYRVKIYKAPEFSL